MADLDVTISIIDGSDALSDLDLTPANGYIVRAGGFAEGGKLFRRQTAESPFVAGRILLGAVPDVMVGTLALIVEGADHDELRTRLAAVRERFEQLAYTLRVSIEGNVDDWPCECADSAIGDGGTYDEVRAVLLSQPITFTFPHAPNPL